MTDSAAAISPAAVPSAAHQPSAWHNGSSFGFRDILDIVNPLQHIPVIGSLYRWATGDRPGEAAQIAGDALYGGPIGVGVGLLSAALEDSEGHDVGERVLTAAFGPGADGPAPAATASTAAAPAPQTASATPAPAAPTLAAAARQLYGGIAQPPPARAVAAAPQPAPDHAPISLYGGVAQPAAGGAMAQVTNPAARALLARAIPLQSGAPAVPHAGAGATAPVPLNVPPGALPAGSVPPGRLPALQSGQPLDISQKMMDGLDKYMRLQDERKKSAGTTDPAPGPSPGAPPTPGIDLSL